MKPRLQRPDTDFADTIGLFNPVSDRQQTRLAYKLSYYPPFKLSHTANGLLTWRATVYLTKAQILVRCNEGLDKIDWLVEDEDKSRPFVIHWEYNNIPTEEEWDKIPASAMFFVDYRISPVIKAGDGRVCVIGFSAQDRGNTL